MYNEQFGDRDISVYWRASKIAHSPVRFAVIAVFQGFLAMVKKSD